MMTGKIVKGIAGFYYVYAADGILYECKAKGSFRKEGVKPLVGDDVELSVLDAENQKGNIEEILPRSSELLRPAVANITQVLVVFAAAKPAPNLNLLDRFLIRMELEQVPVRIGFNKCELITEEEKRELYEVYASAGYPVQFFSVKETIGLLELSRAFCGQTTALAGPSGVGKSSLLNYLCPEAGMETGGISRKIERGKHTTRHAELFVCGEAAYVMDTPGFSTLYLNEIEPKELWEYFPEMREPEKKCRFIGCRHRGEPDCGVKEALTDGRIKPQRYESYCRLYTELDSVKRY